MGFYSVVPAINEKLMPLSMTSFLGNLLLCFDVNLCFLSFASQSISKPQQLTRAKIFVLDLLASIFLTDFQRPISGSE